MAHEGLGRLVWYDLMTHDLAAATEFYPSVFGWRISEMDLGDAGTYRMWTIDDAGFGGVVPLAPEHDMPSYWLPYATVADVDAAVRRATAIGARIGQPATDLPDLGRYAVVVDRAGAALALWTGIQDDVPDQAMPGTIAWSELAARDPDAAIAYYSEVVGWLCHHRDLGELGDYWVFRTDRGETAGMYEMEREARGVAHWRSYVLVDDADATAARIESAGGRLLAGPDDLAGFGRFLTAADPSGAEFGAMTPER